jgi:hypothetical protein
VRDAGSAHTTATPKASFAVARQASAVVPMHAWARIRPQGGALVKQRYMLSGMCGRSSYKLTWEEIVALYRLTLDQPALNSSRASNDDPTLIEEITMAS